jgi:hypothetical protein
MVSHSRLAPMLKLVIGLLARHGVFLKMLLDDPPNVSFDGRLVLGSWRDDAGVGDRAIAVCLVPMQEDTTRRL